MSEQFAPWITDPDELVIMTPDENEAFAAAVFAAYPELVGRTNE